MTLPELYTPEEVADALRLASTNWLEEAARRDEIPHTRLGRRLRFTHQQVQRVIEIHEVGNKPPTPTESTPVQKRKPTTVKSTTKTRRLQARVPARMRNAAAAATDR